ncbi:dethiobiotin synthase [Limisalsivibrio acetivorans]|uniref:dethiobiotin synthase n=1 Tax=Limisalsivibrio acetivorans TaxID=1304888 RepID=UPI0003B76D57|nr:dethiobiotin synthase [Limisalsivibrio acetivorans]
MKLFISGSNTGVGKTIFSALLARQMMQKGLHTVYIKPVQTGYPADDDAAFVKKFAGLADDRALTLYTAEPPVAPCLCFERFPLEQVVDAVDSMKCDCLIVEGAGGIAVPLDYEQMTYEIPRQCGLEVITVLPDRLGCVNEAVLNREFMDSQGLEFHGFALNRHFSSSPNDSENAGIIEKLMPGSIRYLFSDTLSGY